VSPIPVSEGRECSGRCNLSGRALPLRTCVGILQIPGSPQAQVGPLSPASGQLLSSIPYLWQLNSGGLKEPTKFNQQNPSSAEDCFFKSSYPIWDQPSHKPSVMKSNLFFKFCFENLRW